MKVLEHDNKKIFLDFLAHIRGSFAEWQVVEIQQTEKAGSQLPINDVALIAYGLFSQTRGHIFLYDNREMVMVVAMDPADPASHARKIEARLTPGNCTILTEGATLEALKKIETKVAYKAPQAVSSYDDIRARRRDNVVMIADDDAYIRMLVKVGVQNIATIQEVANGNDIIDAYKKYAPNVLFLDIHLPGRDGTAVLPDLLAEDPSAYVVMLSADSSSENVVGTIHDGAKGFMAKPFNRQKLGEYIKKCPTMKD